MAPETKRSSGAIRIGVSSCLLGAEVRFDGQHKRNDFLVDELGPLVEWVPVCPEVEVGMGIPRESVRLVRGPAGRSLMLGHENKLLRNPKTGSKPPSTTPRGQTRAGAPAMGSLEQSSSSPDAYEDWTDRMEAYAARRVARLATLNLRGYVLKSRSPSCGMERVNLYANADPKSRTQPTKTGVGLFAAELLRALPDLPVEEEGRLSDARLRENFIERVFAYHRLLQLWETRWTIRDLITFHTAQKMALLAHSTDGYRALGRLVAEGKKLPRGELRTRYQTGFMATLRKLATPGRQANVLMHMMGHLRDGLDDGDRGELLATIDDHRRGLVPLVVPVVLIRHHARRLAVSYLLGQTYLEPHPKELMLRNRV